MIARALGFRHAARPDGMMQDVEALIELIRGNRRGEALELLNRFPELATLRCNQSGQLHGVTPLHWAAHRNAAELCKRLIDLGADVNDSAGDWWLTPLAWGADAGSAEAVELLLQCGAAVNQDAIVGTTALHAVAMGGSSQGKRDPQAYETTAAILIAHGADISRHTNKQRTPLDEALQNSNEAVAAVLLRHGAERSRV